MALLRRHSLAIALGIGVVAVGGVAAAASLTGDSGSPPCPNGKAATCQQTEGNKPQGQPPPKSNNGPSVTAGRVFQPTGIVATKQSPVPGVPFAQENLWQGFVGNTYTNVGAGSISEDGPGNGAAKPSSTGEILQESGGQFHQVYDSSVPGPFTITSFQGDLLTLQGSNGQTFHYNVATETVLP